MRGEIRSFVTRVGTPIEEASRIVRHWPLRWRVHLHEKLDRFSRSQLHPTSQYLHLRPLHVNFYELRDPECLPEAIQRRAYYLVDLFLAAAVLA
jgi:hypothetical protein